MARLSPKGRAFVAAVAVLVAVVVAAVVLRGCAARGEAQPADVVPPASAGSAQSGSGDAHGDGGQSDGCDVMAVWGCASSDVSQRTDLQGEYQRAWATSEVVDENHVRISFLAGNDRCFGQRAEVSQGPSSVTIDLYEGGIPDAPNACTMEARLASMLIRLDQPVGGRAITQSTDLEGWAPGG